MIVAAGFMFLTAAGDPSKLQKAKDTTYWAIFGAVVVLIAGAIKTMINAWMPAAEGMIEAWILAVVQ